MSTQHFVEDYTDYVRSLMAAYPLDRAMELAVGGSYEEIGAVQAAVLAAYGLKNGNLLVDLGCGSGRTAHAVARRFGIGYVGTDVVPDLLSYATIRCPRHYRFVLHRTLSVPVEDAAADMVCAFSLFTHLLHEETFLYLDDIFRALRPGGTLVFSFLEYAQGAHWEVFRQTVAQHREGRRPHLNVFIERRAIREWAKMIGFERPRFVNGNAPNWEGVALGQSIAVLRRPAAPPAHGPDGDHSDG